MCDLKIPADKKKMTDNIRCDNFRDRFIGIIIKFSRTFSSHNLRYEFPLIISTFWIISYLIIEVKLFGKIPLYLTL